MHKLAIIGNPVAHSLSPLIWHEFARQTGVELEYIKIEAPLDYFEQIVQDFFKAGGLAMNVTAPFKARAFALAKTHNPHALHSQTANLFINTPQGLNADNTDGLGLVADLKRLNLNLTGKNILIIGSGSVIYSVLSSLAAESPARIDLLMRNSAKLSEFQAKLNLIQAYSAEVVYDLVINTTPNNSENKLFNEIKHLAIGCLVYDMTYSASQTLFMHAMEQLNPQIIQANGIGMLIQQAKLGFYLVFGIMPEVENLYPLLQGKLNG